MKLSKLSLLLSCGYLNRGSDHGGFDVRRDYGIQRVSNQTDQHLQLAFVDPVDQCTSICLRCAHYQ